MCVGDYGVVLDTGRTVGSAIWSGTVFGSRLRNRFVCRWGTRLRLRAAFGSIASPHRPEDFEVCVRWFRPATPKVRGAPNASATDTAVVAGTASVGTTGAAGTVRWQRGIEVRGIPERCAESMRTRERVHEHRSVDARFYRYRTVRCAVAKTIRLPYGTSDDALQPSHRIASHRY